MLHSVISACFMLIGACFIVIERTFLRYEASHGARSVELAELLNSLGESELELADLAAAEASFGRAKEALLATENPEEGAVASIDANQARAPQNE